MPGPGRSTAKLQAQPDETWSQLQKRMINMVYDYTELFSEEVANFIELKSTASHTCMGYTVVSLLAVTAFLISIGATIETTPGMRIKPNLYTVIVGPPSSGKEQSFSTIILRNLSIMLYALYSSVCCLLLIPFNDCLHIKEYSI